jgi:hypothetical protein
MYIINANLSDAFVASRVVTFTVSRKYPTLSLTLLIFVSFIRDDEYIFLIAIYRLFLFANGMP